jgi:GMP synthase (glutamine-hydrolysing)
MPRRVDVIADGEDSDAGFVGERLVAAHEADLVFHDRDHLPTSLSPETALVLLLGSARSASVPEQAHVVAAESALVRAALASQIPVMGVCYGAQLLAHALGGQVTAAAQPEIGWFELTSFDPVLCPEGPWTQFHSDAFTAPPKARVLGVSAAGCQGFAHESADGARALAWQFHPEVTSDRFTLWVNRLRTYCARHGADPAQLVSLARPHEPRLRRAAYDLVDAAMGWLDAPGHAGRSPLIHRSVQTTRTSYSCEEVRR